MSAIPSTGGGWLPWAGHRGGVLMAILVLAVALTLTLIVLFPVTLGEALATPPALLGPEGAAVTSYRLPRLVLWLLSLVACTTAMVAGTGLAASAAWRAQGSARGRAWAIGLPAALAVLVFVAFLVGETPDAIDRIYRLLGPHEPELTGMRQAARVYGAVGPAFVVVVLFGMGYATHRPGGDIPEQIRASMHLVRGILYAASVAMVAGTIGTLYRLELQVDPSLVLDDASSELARRLSLARIVSVGYGATYSFLLAAAFVPAAVELRSVVERRAREEHGGEEPDDRKTWIEREGLSVGLFGQAASLLATLAPFLAAAFEGPLANLLDELVS